MFGEIVAGEMELNEYEKIVNQCWHDLPNHYDNIKLDAFGIMPNKKRHGLFEFVRALKTFSARRINEIRKTPGTPVWQPRFYDHIIRNQNELYRIREYIVNNSTFWVKMYLNKFNRLHR